MAQAEPKAASEGTSRPARGGAGSIPPPPSGAQTKHPSEDGPPKGTKEG